MRILIKTATMGGRAPRGQDLRVYAVADDGKRTPIRGVHRVRFTCDGRAAPCIATLELEAEVDVEAELMLPGDAVPEEVVGPEDTTAVGKTPIARPCGPDGHVFSITAVPGDPCRCGRYRRNDSVRGMEPV